jgi:HAD superfamily hydrolase (TIGR01509 family)
MPNFPSLIIFDCDGVLVDSEMISAKVLMEMLGEIGMPIDLDIFRSDFLGRSFANAAARAEVRFGKTMPDGFQERYRERLLRRMATELQPMPNVERVLGALTVPFCLATSSSPQRLALSLGVTGLRPYFEGRMFTSTEVEHGKPAPDLFLHAAHKMGFTPADALVIEDSEMGVRAAQAAHMDVWHFSGGSHIRAGYSLPESLAPDRRVESMASLLSALQEKGACQ